jgi:bifunctional DNA-binding transcriptional regulator/antitoxin component of YhaV-PrlF toxin-antitoxin module
METTTVVNNDGTVTIPADIRELYGILEGAKVHCVMNGYQLEMRIIGTKLPKPKTKPVSGFGMIKTNRPAAPADLNIGDPIE